MSVPVMMVVFKDKGLGSFSYFFHFPLWIPCLNANLFQLKKEDELYNAKDIDIYLSGMGVKRESFGDAVYDLAQLE